MTGPYAQAAGDYWSAGWHGTLPLPARRKASPPEGWTGRGPGDPSYPDVLAWSEGPQGEGNIGLRMPATVVGLDVDDYGEKVGGQTLESGLREYGPLPDTWRTTSRDDGVSGIRLYRVPAGLRWPGTFGPGTEIVCRTHRYAVAPPSIHPEGRTYRWITPDGLTSTTGPRPEELPELPSGWLVGLTGGRMDDARPKGKVTDPEAEAWIGQHDHRGRCPAMTQAVDRVIGEITPSGAHEALAHLPGVLRMGVAGHRGLDRELERVWEAFRTETTRGGRGRTRTDDEAAGEWNRSLVGAVAVVVGDPGEPASSSDPCEPPTRITATDRLDRGNGEHRDEWVLAKLDDALRGLAHAAPSRVMDAAELVGFLGRQAVLGGLLDGEDVEVRLGEALRDVEVPGPGLEGAIGRGAERAAARPWTISHEAGAPDAHEAGAEDAHESDAAGAPEDDDEGPTPEQLAELALQREIAEQRRRRDALRRLQAEDAPPLRWLDFDEFLASPEPELVVPGLFYRDSLSRIIGAPGCGKSFLSLDLALSVALGRDWCDEIVEQGPVVYVMAEGQRVNTQRTKAWLDRHGVKPEELRGHFFTVPDAVLLTEEGVAELVRKCEAVKPVLVVLDTKNAMMAGEENSATDTAVMRRALDALRRASDACVVLVDHTGKAGGDDGRGSNAVKAAMDTQVKVENDGGTPAMVTATVVRDKAAEAGRAWNFYLRMHPPAAVLLPTDQEPEQRVDRAAPDWRTAEGVAVPTELLHFEGPGAKVMPHLARFLAHDASPKHEDPNAVGVSRTEAAKAMRGEGFTDDTVVRRAWSYLIREGYIDRAHKVTTDTGRHVWLR